MVWLKPGKEPKPTRSAPSVNDQPARETSGSEDRKTEPSVYKSRLKKVALMHGGYRGLRRADGEDRQTALPQLPGLKGSPASLGGDVKHP